VREDDKTWLAGHLHYPVHSTVTDPQRSVVPQALWLVVGDKPKAAVLAQDPYQVLNNWQGE